MIVEITLGAVGQLLLSKPSDPPLIVMLKVNRVHIDHIHWTRATWF